MKTPAMIRPRAFASECESEVCLPVRVRYQVNGEGEVEVTHVALESAAFAEAPGRLLWPWLPLSERQALQTAAENEAKRASSDLSS